jgi:hypothetical protein
MYNMPTAIPKTNMTTPDKSRVTLSKLICIVGAFGFLVLATAMGISTFHAWQSNAPLSNWKGGSMPYRDGCLLALAFACMAGAWFYFALKPKSLITPKNDQGGTLNVPTKNMNVRFLKKDDYQELMWPEVSVGSMDFRNVFPGDLVNIATLIRPEATASETRALFEHHTREIAKWILSNRDRFSPGDRFQIILGWPKSVRDSGRQVIKIGGDFEAVSRIADGTTEVVPMNGWTNCVFETTKTEAQPVAHRH